MPSTGTTTATTPEHPGQHLQHVAVAERLGQPARLHLQPTAHAVASSRGSDSTISSIETAISGTTTRIHATTTTRAQVFSAVASGWCQRPGSSPLSTGPIRR